jgi:hypothetical protein
MFTLTAPSWLGICPSWNDGAADQVNSVSRRIVRHEVVAFDLNQVLNATCGGP